jgi:hypothetical protein
MSRATRVVHRSLSFSYTWHEARAPFRPFSKETGQTGSSPNIPKLICAVAAERGKSGVFDAGWGGRHVAPEWARVPRGSHG